MGSNKLHRSFNQGTDFSEISGDLTNGGRKGDVAFGTLTTIHESPLRFGLVYVGSDDGLVHVTPDGGNTWNNITNGLPKDMWISQIWASAHDEGTVYVSLNGYRWDHFEPYVYMSTDNGKNWTKIGSNLPLEPVNVVKEDPSNANILYVGTDHGLYVSLDKGKSFMQWSKDMPATPVHDLVVQERDKDLVVGTHGRSIYIGSIKELQQLTDELIAKPLVVFEVEKQRYNSRWGSTFFGREFKPEVQIPLYVNSDGKATFTVAAEDGTVMKTFEADLKKGLNYPTYDLSFDEKLLDAYNAKLNEKRKADERPINVKKADDGKCYLYAGTFKVTVEKGGESKEFKLVIEAPGGGGGRGSFGEPGERE